MTMSSMSLRQQVDLARSMPGLRTCVEISVMEAEWILTQLDARAPSSPVRESGPLWAFARFVASMDDPESSERRTVRLQTLIADAKAALAAGEARPGDPYALLSRVIDYAKTPPCAPSRGLLADIEMCLAERPRVDVPTKEGPDGD